MSFLHDYLEHASGNECPLMFHVWAGYGCLSAAISRRVWMRLDDSAIYPNLYVLMVGGAGNGKTWALMKAKRIIAELNLPFSGSVETPQGMWRFMTGDPNREKPLPPYGGAEHKLFLEWPDGVKRDVHPMNIIASEFVDFINLDDKGWINALNNIYDEDTYHYRTKGQGEDYIQGPYVTLIGGLTTQVSASMQKDQIINTGLARRTLFQFGERQWNNPHPNPVLTEEQKRARIRAVDHLRKVKLVSGEFCWSPETNKWWHEWYGPNLASVPTKPPSTQSWFASKSTQLMKLAMLTSLSERLDRVLEVSHFELALAYLNELEKDLYKIFGGVGRNELADVSLKIYNYVSLLTEPIAGKTLFIRFFRELPHRRSGDTEFNDCLRFLCGDGKLKMMNLSIGNSSFNLAQDAIIATPEVLDAFVRKNAGVNVIKTPQPAATVAVPSVATPFAPQPEAPTSSHPALPPSSDPSTAPPSTPVVTSPEGPIVASPAAGTSIAPLPMVMK